MPKRSSDLLHLTFLALILSACAVTTPSPIPTINSNSPTTVTRTLTPSPTLTATITPTTTITPTPEHVFPLMGRFFFVSESEIFMVTLICNQHTRNCVSDSLIQLTNTPRPEQEFLAYVNVDQITASPDGKYVAFAYRESVDPTDIGKIIGGWDLYVLDVEQCMGLPGGCPPELFTRLTSEPFDEVSPAWAPDGSQIAYCASQDGSKPSEIYVMNPDGSAQTRIVGRTELTANYGTVFYPAWSPDSKQIVFNAMTGIYRHPDIFIFSSNRDGSGVRQLTYLPHEENANKSDFRPQWSPDGTHILFEANRDPFGLYLMDTDGSNLRSIMIEGGFPRWSPDGTMIAYHGRWGLELMKLESGIVYTVVIPVPFSIFIWTK